MAVHSLRKYLTIEPVLFLYVYGLLMHVPVIQQYIYYRMSEQEGFPYQPGQNQSCDDGGLNATMKELEKKVQSVSSYLHLGIVLFSSIPSIFVALFMGGWTDKVGRRPGIISPCIDSTLEVIVCLATIYFKLPLYVLFVGGLLHGIFGYFTTISLSCMAYIADTTDESQRAFRLGIIELLVFMGGVVSQLSSGLWIEKLGFVAPYLFISACLLTSSLYAIFLVPESRPPRPRNQRGSLFSLSNAKSALRAYKDAPPARRKNLILLTICDGIDTQGVSGVITLFLLHSPLCFSPELVGYYAALRLFVMGLGAAVGIKLFGLCMQELNISRIGMLSLAVFLLFTGFSRSKLIFIGPALGFFGSCSIPTFKAMMSKLVGPDQQGSLFSAVASMETLCTFVGAALFSALYPVSLKFGLSKGFVFFLGASLLVIPLVLSSFVRFTPAVQIEEFTKSHNEGEKQEEISDGNENARLIT